MISKDNLQFNQSIDLSPLQLEYPLLSPPLFYIQGSYVLDKLFNKTYARDIDVFISEGSSLPPYVGNKPVQITSLDQNSFFPPVLGCYNIDRYILIDQAIVAPTGYPAKPSEITLLSGYEPMLTDIIRGIKDSLRYSLKTDELANKWKSVLTQQFDPIWMQSMLFNSEQEIINYLLETVTEETSSEEKSAVLDIFEKLTGRKLS